VGRGRRGRLAVRCQGQIQARGPGNIDVVLPVPGLGLGVLVARSRLGRRRQSGLPWAVVQTSII
jgi:hypothetical protein